MVRISGLLPVYFRTVYGQHNNLNLVNGNSETINTKEYYDESIGRDAASRILSQHGSKHSFLIRARNAAGDVLTAPYVMDFFIFFVPVRFLSQCQSIRCRISHLDNSIFNHLN